MCLKQEANTVIIFDWDDTLFPTSDVNSDGRISFATPLQYQSIPDAQREDLAKCAEGVETVLRSAAACGKLILVTLAAPAWLAASSEVLFPSIGRLLRELGVEIVYARQSVRHGEAKNIGRMTMAEQTTFWGKIKARAVASLLSKMRPTNVISIGDSEHDGLGVKKAARNLVRNRNSGLAVQTKTLKFIARPTVVELTDECSALLEWLPFIVAVENNYDLEVNNEKGIQIEAFEKPMVEDERAVEDDASCFPQLACWLLAMRGGVLPYLLSRLSPLEQIVF